MRGTVGRSGPTVPLKCWDGCGERRLDDGGIDLCPIRPSRNRFKIEITR